ncbi:MAG: response regulator [Elusimicrobiota bacterium]
MKKILVIDDEKDVLTYLDTLLKDNGYTTILADKVDDALDQARKDRPDLITLDITMPEKSGIKAYRAFREDDSLKDIPIVVVTAVTGYANDPESFKKFISSRKKVPPPDGFIPKPIDRDALVKTIKDLIG